MLVSERGAEVAAELALSCNARVLSNQAVVDGADVVFLCLRPAVWADSIGALNFRSEQQVISVMAGVPFAQIERAVAPVSDISITVPIGFLERGGCPLPVYPKPEPLTSLFGPENPVIAMTQEGHIADHFAGSALLSAVLTVMQDGSEWLAERTGNAAGADTYYASLLAGFLRDVPKDAQARILEARTGLASPKTLNRRVVDAMETANTRQTVRDALQDLRDGMK